ncbi:SMI1/KNR4 family protein [Sorangium sp. So ce260]|uniref:SMI1/KNR4 family protein n=1 Tax=Sorangium sp. So ce260 TaxID=3133291 RepID=UPI003F5E04B7
MRSFIEYASRFDPAMSSRIRGATQDEIRKLELVSGHSLPSDYRDYLALMGHGDDRTISVDELSTDVSDVISFYEENVATGEDSVPDDCIIIGVDGVIIEQVYLEHQPPGRVFFSSDGQKHGMWAESLGKLLCKHAYMRYRPRQLHYSAAYATANPRPAIDAARTEALRMGFAPQWFSDAITFCGERSGIVIIINQFERQGLLMRVAASRPEPLDALVQRIAEAAAVDLKSIPG